MQRVTEIPTEHLRLQLPAERSRLLIHGHPMFLPERWRNGLTAGLYSIAVTDANGWCRLIGLFLDEPAPLAVLMFANNVKPWLCDGWIYLC